MSTHDINGRPYAKLSELKAGDTVELDTGFTCMEGQRKVCLDELGFYLLCDEGHHYLLGQADDGIHCVGVYRIVDPVLTLVDP